MRRPTLDTSNDLTSGLVFCAVGGSPIDLVSGQRGTLVGNATFNGTPTKWGPAFESFTTAGTDIISFPNVLLRKQITNKHTIVVALSMDSTNAFQKVVCVPYNSSGAWSGGFYSLAFGVTGSWNEAEDDINLSGTPEAAIVAGMFDNTTTHVYATSRSGTAVTMYRDGPRFGTATHTSSAATDWGTSNIVCLLARSTGSTGDGTDGRLAFVGIWNRVLSPREHMLMGADPMRIVRPAFNPVPLLGILTQAGGSDATVNATAVAGVGTVNAPTLTASANPAPSAVAGVGSVKAPTITASATVSPSAVAGVGVVNAPTVTASATVSPSAVAGVGVVNAPTVTTTGDATVSPSAVVGVGTVNAPSLTASASVSAATVVGVGTVNAPTVTTTGDAIASPSAVVGVGVVQAPTITATATVSPSVVAGVGSVKAPTLTASASITLTTVAGVAAIASPGLTATATVSPSAVAGVGVVRSVTVTTSGGVTPTGGNAVATIALVYGATSTLTVQGSSSSLSSEGSTSTLTP